MDTAGRKDGRGILIDKAKLQLEILRFRKGVPHGSFLIIDYNGNKKCGQYDHGEVTNLMEFSADGEQKD